MEKKTGMTEQTCEEPAESSKKEEKEPAQWSHCAVFQVSSGRFFFLGSTTSSKRKRKFRSHDTEIRKQERKLNHTDSEKAEAVTRRLLTVLVHT